MGLPWVKLNEFYYTPTQVKLYPLGGDGAAVYVMTHLPSPLGPQAMDQWHTVDLTAAGIPADAKAAFLSGMLIITHGTTVETADIHLTFREHGDASADVTKYIAQSCEAHVGGGQRSTMATWVPLKDGKFDFSYHIATPGAWPTNSAYGINLSVQMWGR